MFKRKLFSFITLIVLMGSLVSPALAVGETGARASSFIVEDEDWQTYTLVLDMPSVTVAKNARPAEVPGYFHAALYKQWMEVEGLLKALQERELVLAYELYPEANAFSVQAASEAVAMLSQLGELKPATGRQSVTDLNVTFQAQLNADIFAAQSRAIDAQPEPRTVPETEAAPVRTTEPVADPEPPTPQSEMEMRPAAADTQGTNLERAYAPPGQPVIYVRGYRDYDWYNGEYSIGGYVNDCQEGSVDLEIRDSNGDLKEQERIECYYDDSFRWYLNDPVEAGDVVQATFGMQTTSVTVPEFTANVDVEADKVTGTISDVTILTDTYGLTQTLTLWPQTEGDAQWDAYKSVIPVSGAFTAANPFNYSSDTQTMTVDIEMGDVGHARYIDADENRVYFHFAPPPGAPVVYVRGCYNEYYAQDSVGGYVPGFDSSLHGYGTIILKDGAGQVKAQRDHVWASNSFCVELDVNIEAEDVVEVTFGDETTTVDVPAFGVVSDADADTLSGSTDATIITETYGMTQTLAVWPNTTYDHDDDSGSPLKRIETSGTFVAANPFEYWDWSDWMTTTVDIRPGDRGHLRYIDAEGNRVYDAFRAPMFYARGYSWDYWSDDYVRALVNPGVNVAVTLERQGHVWATAEGEADEDGVWDAYLEDIYENPVYIEAGDELTFEYGDQTAHITVPDLVANADPDADEVSGIGPADVVSTTQGVPHTLEVYVDSTGWTENVTTTNSGAFVVTGTVNLGDSGWLRYVNDEGYYVYNDFRLPVIYARGNDGYEDENYVAGYVASGSTGVTVNLIRDGYTLASTIDMADVGGWYSVNLRDIYDNAVAIEGGDVIEVTAGGETLTMTVPTFDDLVSDAGTDTITGLTDAEVVTDTISTYNQVQTLAIWPNRMYDNTSYGVKNVMPDATGAFTATNPFYEDDWMMGWYTTTVDINPNEAGHLRYIDAEGNRTYARFQAEADMVEPSFYIRGWYDSDYICDMFSCYYDEYEYYRGDNFFGLRLADNCAAAYSYDEDALVTLKNMAGETLVKDTVDFSCYRDNSRASVWFDDVYGNAQPIEAGHTIAVLMNGKTYTYTVRNLYAGDVLEKSPGMIRGLAPGGITADEEPPSLWAETSWGDHKYLTTTRLISETTLLGEGAYVYTTMSHDIYQNGGTFDLRFKDVEPNTQVLHTTWYRKNFEGVTQPPVVYVRGSSYEWYGNTYVSGYVPGACDYAEVVLKDAEGEVKQEKEDWACSSFDVWFDEPIEAGDSVEVTFDDVTSVVEVPAFDVSSDSVEDRVTGTTDADVMTDTYGMTQTLAIWPDGTSNGNYGKYVLPDATGVFTAANPFYSGANPSDWSTKMNWDPGTRGHLRYVDANGNQVYASFVAPRLEPEIWVHKDGYDTHGWLTKLEGPVTVTLMHSDSVKAVAYDQVNDYGHFDVTFYNDMGVPVMIEEGDAVVVRASAPITVMVPALSGVVNADTEQVSGVGPVDALLNVIVEYNEALSVLTGGDGAYLADFGGRFDIKPGDYVEVDYRNTDGHTVYIDFYAGPQLNVQLYTNYAWGYAPAANTPVTLTLKTGDTVKGMAYATSNNGNYFSASFYNSVGQRVFIAGGDTVEAAFGDGSSASMVAAPLTAQMDVDEDTISGTGPADDRLGVLVDYSFNATVSTDATGQWDADPGAAGEDITPGDQAHIRHINTDRHVTWLYAVAPVVYVRGYGPWATAYWADNYVAGYASARGATVDIALKRDSKTVAEDRQYLDRNSSYYTFWLYDDFGMDADIQSGDQLIIGAPATQTLDIPPLDAVVDAENDTVSGTGPANATLGIYVDGQGKSVTTDGTGAFSADFDNIDPWDSVYLRYHTPAGNWIHALFRADVEPEAAAIYARWDGGDVCNACASGWAGVGNAVATVSLSRDGTTLAAETQLTGNTGWFDVAFADNAGDPLDIADGDVIGVQSGGEAVSMTVTALTAQANPDTGVLYGTGPANEDLHWQMYGNSGDFTINPDGRYAYNIGLGSRSVGYVYYTNAGGHRTYLGWAAPYFGVQEHSNYVNGYTSINAPVDVRLLTSAGEERARASATTSGSGYFYARFKDTVGAPVLINPNDQVVFRVSAPVTVPVVPLDATVNVVSDTVTGTGPAGEWLEVTACDWRKVMADAEDGAFTADFSDICDFKAGTTAWVNHYNDDGHRVYAEFRANLIRVNHANDLVDGFVRGYAPVSLSLIRPGVTGTLATAETTAGPWGMFSAYFEDAEGETVDIQPGDTVEVTASPMIPVTVVDLSASINTATDTISGTGPANATLVLWAFDKGGGVKRQKVVETDASGTFSVDFVGEMDLTTRSYTYARYTDAAGHQVFYATQPMYSPLLNAVKEDIADAGASMQAYTLNVANDGDLTTPLIYKASGGALSLIFTVRGGNLVLTRPDGSTETVPGRAVIHNPAAGIWKAQIDFTDNDGEQYVIAVGEVKRPVVNIFLPLVLRNAD